MRASRRDLLNMVRREFETRGIPYTIEHTNGQHQRIKWIANGKPDSFIIPFSPSDWRGILNARADIRRKLKGAHGRGHPRFPAHPNARA